MRECADDVRCAWPLFMRQGRWITPGNQFIITPYHYNKEVVQPQQVEVLYVKSNENIADLTTKSVHRNVLDANLDRLTGNNPITDKTIRD